MSDVGKDIKARDVDRDLAIDFVEAAWADGQLTREEYDVRVDRLLRARTLGALERDLSDLQGPDGAPWRPDGAAVPVSHLARDRAVTASTAAPNATGLRAGGGLFAALIGCLAVVGGCLAIANDTPDAPTGRHSTVEVETDSPLSAQGYRNLVAELDRETGETSAFELRLQEYGAQGSFPSEPTGTLAESRTWDGQKWSEPTMTSLTRERFNLEMISPDTVEEAFVQASVALTGDVRVELRLAVVEVAGVRSCLQATSTADGESITESYDCQGNLIDEGAEE